MDAIIFYAIAAAALIVSLIKDKRKTLTALKKALKSFENILPPMFAVLLVVGVVLAIMDAKLISKILGTESGFLGVVIGAVVGSITLMPGFVAFPTAAMLVQAGAGYMQIAAFVSSLMMVGVITLPVEFQYFGRRLAILRNAFAFVFSFLVACIIRLVVG